MIQVSFEVYSIGHIRTEFKTSDGIPIQSFASQAIGYAEVKKEYIEGLESLSGFSHIILLYWFHNAKSPNMMVKPYLDTKMHGLFSTRAPARPNPIGLSIVKLIAINGRVIEFSGADMIDGSPLLDIKPFVPDFDNRLDATSGWLETSSIKKDHDLHADDRFEN